MTLQNENNLNIINTNIQKFAKKNDILQQLGLKHNLKNFIQIKL